MSITYGVTDTGFVKKPLNIIRAEVDDSLKSKFGNHINTSPQSLFGQLRDIFSEREALWWENLEDAYNSPYPNMAESVSLDNAISITGLIRIPEAYSQIKNQALFGDVDTLIPEGTIFSVENDTDTKFETLEDATLGAGVDAIQFISIATTPDAGGFYLTFDDETTSQLTYASTADNIETALNALDALSEVSVAGSFAAGGFTVGFTGADGKQPQVSLGVSSNTLSLNTVAIDIAIDTEVREGEYQATVDCQALETGPLTCAAKTLTVINNPISGLDSVFNPEDAVVGRYVETDAEARIRRNNRLQISEAGPIDAIREAVLSLNDDTTQPEIESVTVFENATESVDSRGIPANQFEVVVYQEDGGETRDQEIADAILGAKPAGIGSYGTISIATYDSQGFYHLTHFSRPEEVNIYLVLDLTTNNDYPENGDEDIAELIATWGNSLGVGEDVIIYPTLIAQLITMTGITDVTIKIGTAASPTLDNNIEIDDGTSGHIQLSRWSVDRIEVNS